MSVVEQTAAPVSPGRVRLRRTASRQAWTLGVIGLLIALLIVQANVSPSFTAFDVQSLVIAGLPLAFAGMAQAVVVIARGLDLSIGAVMALTNVIAAKLMEGHGGLGTALALSVLVLLIGLVIGTINGIAVVWSGVPDIIATLALGFSWFGVALVVLPTPGGAAPASYQNLSSGSSVWEWIPNGLLILAGICIIAVLLLRKTRLGLAIYAVGSDPTASELSGVRVGRTREVAYAIGGVIAAFGGLALTSTTGIGSPISGDLYTLSSVAAAVIGGVSLTGGKGGMLGPIIAAFVLTAAVTVLTFLGLASSYGQVIQGALIVLVVMAGGLLLRRRAA
jgi:ribose transport system permease protein